MLKTALLLAATWTSVAMAAPPSTQPSEATPRNTWAADDGFVVHEWGSVKFFQGASGGDLGPLSEDQSDLPRFVQVWANQPAINHMIVEKPILYFYSDKKVSANVVVKSPLGLLTQWYPQAQGFTPQRGLGGRFIVDERRGMAPANGTGGSLTWQAKVDPALGERHFRRVDADHPWWHTARDTDATPVSAGGDTERFLFYRGTLGTSPAVKAETTDTGVTLRNTGQLDIGKVFVVRSRGGVIRVARVDGLPAAKSAEVRLDQVAPEADVAGRRAELAAMLEDAGLYDKEAAGLATIWARDWFTGEGDRVLYLMPRPALDAALPLTVTPTPTQTVRVLVVQLELETPERRERITTLVRQLGDASFEVRESAQQALLVIDRFAEAELRRVAQSVEDPEVQRRADYILEELAEKRVRDTDTDVRPAAVRFQQDAFPGC